MLPRAVIIHGLEDARKAIRAGRRLVLLSAPGAGCFGGARWWRLVADVAATDANGLIAADILHCGDQAGRAVEALREGCRLVVLDPACPAFADVAARADALGAALLPRSPPALDMASRGAARHLAAWLDGERAPG